MLLDRDAQVFGPAVVKEEDALADTPQWSRAEFVAIGGPLRHAVRQSRSHVVHGKIAERLNGDVALPRQLRFRGGEGLGVACLAADIGKDLTAAGDRGA